MVQKTKMSAFFTKELTVFGNVLTVLSEVPTDIAKKLTDRTDVLMVLLKVSADGRDVSNKN